jgi:hypothetical protein
LDNSVNYHYSLSNLFNNGPFYHIGAKVNYAFSDKFGIMVGLVNNWDALTDWKKQKSTIAQVFVSPVEGWNIYVNYIGGYNDDGFKVAAVPGATVGNTAYPIYITGYTRNLFDLTTGYQVTDKLYFGLNAAYGWYSFNSLGSAVSDSTYLATSFNGNTPTSMSMVSWWGIAGYANYQFTDWLGLGIRYEHFDDKYGVRYILAVNNSFTITAPITLADGHLILKPEFRMDISSKAFYEDKNGNAINNQQTLGMAFIYKY